MEVGLEMGIEAKMEKMQKPEHKTAPTIREIRLDDFLSKIDQKYFRHAFRNPLLRIMEERRAEGDNGVYNTAEKVIAAKKLAHLNVQAKQGDECDPAAMEEIRAAYGYYHEIMKVLDERMVYGAYNRKLIFQSVHLFSLLVRDFLTRKSERIIHADPIIAALKLAFDPEQVAARLRCKGIWSMRSGIDYIRTRMAAKVRKELVEWCYKAFPAEADRLELPKEAPARKFEVGENFELVTCLDQLYPDDIDVFQYQPEPVELKEIIEKADRLINDGHVFHFGSDDEGYGCFLLHTTEDGKYYQQQMRDMLSCWCGCEGLVLVEDKDKIDAILDTGIAPIMLTDEDLKECGLGA